MAVYFIFHEWNVQSRDFYLFLAPFHSTLMVNIKRLNFYEWNADFFMFWHSHICWFLQMRKKPVSSIAVIFFWLSLSFIFVNFIHIFILLSFFRFLMEQIFNYVSIVGFLCDHFVIEMKWNLIFQNMLGFLVIMDYECIRNSKNVEAKRSAVPFAILSIKNKSIE